MYDLFKPPCTYVQYSSQYSHKNNVLECIIHSKESTIQKGRKINQNLCRLEYSNQQNELSTVDRELGVVQNSHSASRILHNELGSIKSDAKRENRSQSRALVGRLLPK